ncbi:chaperonin 10-like protein [Macrophomina phaseolina]|uniref:Chaperonin 10-like protein n=1 Tax=Macrophomina phaseolina TaxID=35725 RepID=A0ABQ8GVT8_9PEZI|nr:chaperonin 10-like protein [Macrophomina phaseolina]
MASYTQTRAIVAKGLPTTAPKPTFVFETLELSDPADDEVIVRMVGTGICHSDLVFACMPGPDRVLGHEGAGYITALGRSVTHLQINDPVLLSYTCCGDCAACTSTPPRVHACTSMLSTNSAHPGAFKRTASASFDVAGRFFGQSSFAHFSRAHVRSVVPLGDFVSATDPDADLRLLAPLGCGFMTGAGTVVNALKANGETAVLVTGLGAVGFGAVMAAKLAGCKVIVAVDRVASRLERAREFGATHVVNTAGTHGWEKIVQAVKEAAPEGIDGVVETTGAVAVMQASMRVLRREGQVVLLAPAPPGDGLMIPYKELQYLSAKVNFLVMGEAYPQDFVPRMLKWWRDGEFPIEKLVKEYPIEKWEDAIAAMLESGEVVKPVLVW